MSPPANLRAQAAEARRGAILVAAKEEFVAKGFAAARIEDIARRAGVAKGTVYLSFPDKEQLFESVISDHMAPLAARLRSRLADAGGSVRAMLEPVLLSLLDELHNGETGPVLRLLLSEAIRFPRLGERYGREVIEPTLQLQRFLLARAAQTGELRNPATADFPQLILAPVIVGLIWQGVFNQAMPLDLDAMVKAQLDALFMAPPEPRGG